MLEPPPVCPVAAPRNINKTQCHQRANILVSMRQTLNGSRSSTGSHLLGLRKVKCGGEHPCANCQNDGVLCSFSNSKPVGRPRKRPRGTASVGENVFAIQDTPSSTTETSVSLDLDAVFSPDAFPGYPDLVIPSETPGLCAKPGSRSHLMNTRFRNFIKYIRFPGHQFTRDRALFLPITRIFDYYPTPISCCK